MKHILIVLALLLPFATSCGVDCKDPKNASRVECTAPKVPGDFIDCAKADLTQMVDKDHVMTLIGKVATVLLAGGDGWQQALEGIGKDVGQDVLACAVKATGIVFASRPPGTLATAEPPPGAQRAQQFLAAHPDWKFKQ